MKKTRVAVWGLGKHAVRNILPALDRGETTELLGITTRDQQVAIEEHTRYGCRRWTNPDEMLADPEVEAVYLATPIGLHHTHGLRVLNAGKHLWCEKSLADSYPHAKDLIELSRKHRLSLCEGFMFAYHPHFRRVVNLVSSGFLGQIFTITCRFGLPHLDFDGFRYSNALGGGALLDVGCYPLSATIRIMGEEPSVIRCLRGEPAGFEVDTDGRALLQFPSGPIAYLEWGLGRAYRNEIELWGERGSVLTDKIFSKPEDHLAKITVLDHHGAPTEENVPRANAFVEMFAAFSRAVSDEAAQEVLRNEAEVQARCLNDLRQAGTGTG
jgi:dTDP-3,4-didehydro-2,6-dideoxy-alpha-D-glucose 3-reductase